MFWQEALAQKVIEISRDRDLRTLTVVCEEKRVFELVDRMLRIDSDVLH